jgi:hypothetical protein
MRNNTVGGDVRDSEAQSTWTDPQYFRTGYAVQQGSGANLRHPASLGSSDCFR